MLEQEQLIRRVLDAKLERADRHILIDEITLQKLIEPEVLRTAIDLKRREYIATGMRKDKEAKFLQAVSISLRT